MKREPPGAGTRGLALIDDLQRADIKVPTNYGKDKVTGWLREVAQHSSSQSKWKKYLLWHERLGATSWPITSSM